MLAVGVPPVIANASNAVALWPGSLAGAWAFRRELRRFSASLPALSAIAFVGGIGGGLLLLRTSNDRFSALIPWLLLLATLLFAFSGPLSSGMRALLGRAAERERERGQERERERGRGQDRERGQEPEHAGGHSHAAPARHFGLGGYLFQGVVSIYGGFFGAGMGILMIAALAIQGFEDLYEINALKNWLSAVIYSVAVATFVLADAVSWPHTLVMLVAATIGGYLGAAWARRIPALWLRRFIIGFGALLTAWYFPDAFA
jgi:uncharacterized membrane protein YfcA